MNLLFAALLLFAFTSCKDNVEYEDKEVTELTHGVVTEVEEFETDIFKITDETEVPKVEDSRIIAKYMNGTIDTFTLEEAKLVAANSPKGSAISNVLMGGAMGFLMGRALSSGINRSAYASDAAFNKAQATSNNLNSTAIRKTVRTPKAGKSGFGSRKSTRSYGG
ncbi:MAG TPA: hypothetical protein PK147_08255 [Saprospiraceae bacterium]|nr:hypothetical protein [Saprospiraceae bacterium]MCB9328733.1 hypothetical protein [Lewinellaceae bacterium]HPK09099.1 hypothetical protein [Saprospiraceae bacterium]HPQ21829.1 hypothetical protein [Saprospiraceae bacterium]HRX27912.1 hypothetical protein [Saprospiraceae bacterium]